MDQNQLGPAERIIQTVTQYTDHAVHNRPGIVIADARTTVGVRWEPCTHKVENGEKVVYRLQKVGKKNTRARVGVIQPDNRIVENGAVVGRYQPAGLFQEVVTWIYTQISEVWKLDNEFAARWASYEFRRESRDLKVILAAFMLVQSRKGEPVMENGKRAFNDEDFRSVGEAMLLTFEKDTKNFDPKLMLRVRDVLEVPGVAAINRNLGFGRSTRKAFIGRWPQAVERWLRHRERNPKLLEGLVKNGFRQHVMDMCAAVGFKPETNRFYETLRWKQTQASDGRRSVAIGANVKAAATWDDLTEEQICQRIVKEKPNYKVLTNLVPTRIGFTRAVLAAAIEAGSFSNKDLVIATPTLEEVGLLQVQDIRDRWQKAVKESEDMRSANIARNVKTKEVKETLQEGADSALKKAVEVVMRNMRVYVIVDISGSMEGAIEAAKTHLAKFVQGFPPDKLHVSVFNTSGREITIKHASAAGVTNAFRGIAAGGGTDYGAGVRVLEGYKPKPDEDVIFIFVGDEGAPPFAPSVRASGLSPLAFGLVPTVSTRYGRGNAVQETARILGLPCFEIDEKTFDDPYAIPRTIRNIIAATPLTAAATPRQVATPRVSLVETILKTDLLKKPTWALTT
jgi:uncharacterized protein (UPF0297 family)